MNEPPQDLAGYQRIVLGVILEGDIIVWHDLRLKEWAGPSMQGGDVESIHFDVYRKMPCPKAGDHDKGWREVADRITHGEIERDLTKMASGSLRENKTGKGRFDLIPYEPVRQLAVHFETGGKIHGDRNWELGQPLSLYVSAAKRHSSQVGCDFSENRAIASCWNYFCFLQTVRWIEEGKLPKELDDIGWIKQKNQK